MEHLMLQQLTECQAPAHNSTVVSMSYDTLRVTQTILLHHNENCAISVTIVRIVCLCVCVFVFMRLCGAFGARGRSGSLLRSEGLMAPLSVNWQVKSLKASRILFDETEMKPWRSSGYSNPVKKNSGTV